MPRASAGSACLKTRISYSAAATPEMLRAMRLVADTGLHALGWTRLQAIDYMLKHSAMGRTDVVAEVERYIVDPGQALAYKIGALTIQRLRRQGRNRRSERALTRGCSIREVLMTGAIPMTVLEASVDDWIASFRPSKELRSRQGRCFRPRADVGTSMRSWAVWIYVRAIAAIAFVTQLVCTSRGKRTNVGERMPSNISLESRPASAATLSLSVCFQAARP